MELITAVCYFYYFYYYYCYHFYHHHYGSTALCLDLASFFNFFILSHSNGHLGWRISLSQGLCLHTQQHKHRINACNKNIHALSVIRTHDPNISASEGSSCLRRRYHCDLLITAACCLHIINKLPRMNRTAYREIKCRQAVHKLITSLHSKSFRSSGILIRRQNS
jgi:hypothetical protein